MILFWYKLDGVTFGEMHVFANRDLLDGSSPRYVYLSCLG